MGDWKGSVMLYPLERRSTSLVMPALLFNYLQENRIPYEYNFEQGGIEIPEEQFQKIQNMNFIPAPSNIKEEPIKRVSTSKSDKHIRRKLI